MQKFCHMIAGSEARVSSLGCWMKTTPALYPEHSPSSVFKHFFFLIHIWQSLLKMCTLPSFALTDSLTCSLQSLSTKINKPRSYTSSQSSIQLSVKFSKFLTRPVSAAFISLSFLSIKLYTHILTDLVTTLITLRPNPYFTTCRLKSEILLEFMQVFKKTHLIIYFYSPERN